MKKVNQSEELFGLKEINESGKREISGGIVGDWIVYGPECCCYNIPPSPWERIIQIIEGTWVYY
jgi:hypothetical protein